jgi:preprotein translocase subunit SecD
VARPTPVRRAIRSLIWLLVIIAALAGVNTFGHFARGADFVPELGLDLQGGTAITLAPKLVEGTGTITDAERDQAVGVIRTRINDKGVSEAQITPEGSSNILVQIPGPVDKDTVDRITAPSRMTFRPVLQADSPSTAQIGDGTTTATPTPTQSPTLVATPSAKPTDASDPNWVTPALTYSYENDSCEVLKERASTAKDDQPVVTCTTDNSEKYILGPVELSGTDISSASSGVQTTQQGASTGVWAVNIKFNGDGTKTFADVTTRLFAYGTSDVRNRFAIVLDGGVITAPTTNAVIANGEPQISGSFTETSAKALADKLNSGSLPISFTVLNQYAVSATLGTTQLLAGLLAGLIGLILVVIYSLVQYRALAMVTVGSLALSALLTYGVVLFLSWYAGYRLSLAGVAGLVVAIGITADSFIVYFERIRDELRDGRALESAVEAGWSRAIRTILASDAVNFLAAAVLYVLAVGNVRGFALTLGLTTILDVVVVVLFTHPIMRLLARLKFFGEGHSFSGLDPRALGAVYRGRAQFRAPVAVAKRDTGASREAARRQTIAERKAAESSGGTDSKGKES